MVCTASLDEEREHLWKTVLINGFRFIQCNTYNLGFDTNQLKKLKTWLIPVIILAERRSQ